MHVQLVDGHTSEDGRVEICLDGTWGSVCDDRWSFRDAQVLCRQLGFDGREITLYLTIPNNILLFTMPASSPLISNSSTEKLLHHLEYVHCNGTEGMLNDCNHSGAGIYDCADESTVGVICASSLSFFMSAKVSLHSLYR